jgi:hypothetical protein
MEKYTKNQNIYSCLSGEHMCVIECIYISIYKEEYKKLKGNSRNIVTQLKKFHKELFNKPFPKKFDGLDIIKTLELAANKYEIKFVIYNHDENERLQHLNTIGTGETIHNLLMINGVEENDNNNSSNNNNIITHVMYIKDIQKYTKLHICPKCCYIPPASNNKSYHKDRFDEYVQKYKKIIMSKRTITSIHSSYTEESNICLFTCS